MELGGIAPGEEAFAVLWKASNVAEMQSGGEWWRLLCSLEREENSIQPVLESVHVLKKLGWARVGRYAGRHAPHMCAGTPQSLAARTHTPAVRQTHLRSESSYA